MISRADADVIVSASKSNNCKLQVPIGGPFRLIVSSYDMSIIYEDTGDSMDTVISCRILPIVLNPDSWSDMGDHFIFNDSKIGMSLKVDIANVSDMSDKCIGVPTIPLERMSKNKK
jgi:hypothetical protein